MKQHLIHLFYENTSMNHITKSVDTEQSYLFSVLSSTRSSVTNNQYVDIEHDKLVNICRCYNLDDLDVNSGNRNNNLESIEINHDTNSMNLIQRKNLLETDNFDDLIVENNLNKSYNINELFSSNYVVYRCDRSDSNSVCHFGGGVLIAVNSMYPSEIILLPKLISVEIVLVKTETCKKSYYIFCIYIPSGSSQLLY